ncbi:ADP-ribosylglycohydrolase family protein [Cellulomonas sp. JZ18]|uniref:ADP-ribosylglycohydrolase family protein n=1 Tax=Cellulomonas sp. JZ18 TaxID=2654191 RepID=UPI0012D3BCE4|nr:ADP-ribosylglycohydrolase family protein [Cellulomonas sp. JZ18]QGQ19159.1 ADP-ribosylglycohydrolase family protein [Cellulomonas sp. JZ18]
MSPGGGGDDRLRDHAHGCLAGVALGDALGMPVEGWTRARIAAELGVVDRLLPGTDRGMATGTVTDDTEQTLMLAAALTETGGVPRVDVVVRHLLAWVDAAGPRADAVIGPSTAAALTLLRAGADPRTTGRSGRTNGAAMRVAPVGVVVPTEDLDALVDAVEETCVMSHHTSEALAGAAAVAAVVSSALAQPGADLDGHVAVARAAAALAGRRGTPAAGPRLLAALDAAVEVARTAADDEDFLRRLVDEVGTSVAAVESVPAAVACLVRADADPWRAAVLGASAGGDADTVASMAAGMAGAVAGLDALPAEPLGRVVAVNRLDLAPVAERLVVLRRLRVAT